MWETLKKKIDLEDSTPFIDQVYLGETQQKAINDENLIRVKNDLSSKMTNSDTNVPVNNKKDQKAHNVTSWSYDMKGHAEKYAQRHCELSHKSPAQLHNVATPCRDDHLKI